MSEGNPFDHPAPKIGRPPETSGEEQPVIWLNVTKEDYYAHQPVFANALAMDFDGELFHALLFSAFAEFPEKPWKETSTPRGQLLGRFVMPRKAVETAIETMQLALRLADERGDGAGPTDD